MTAQRVPAEVYSLQEMLCDEFEARGWKTADAARRFDNGLTQSMNLLALNMLMLGMIEPLHNAVIEGLANALGVSEEFLRNMEGPVNPRWMCPEWVLSQEQRDYLV